MFASGPLCRVSQHQLWNCCNRSLTDSERSAEESNRRRLARTTRSTMEKWLSASPPVVGRNGQLGRFERIISAQKQANKWLRVKFLRIRSVQTQSTRRRAGGLRLRRVGRTSEEADSTDRVSADKSEPPMQRHAAGLRKRPGIERHAQVRGQSSGGLDGSRPI